MAELSPSELIRARVENALTASQVNLASADGRAQAEALMLRRRTTRSAGDASGAAPGWRPA